MKIKKLLIMMTTIYDKILIIDSQIGVHTGTYYRMFKQRIEKR